MPSIENLVRPERIEHIQEVYLKVKILHDSMDQTEEYNSVTLLYLSRALRLIADAIYEAKFESKNSK